MQLYYRDDTVTLYHGDTFDVLPQLAEDSIDVVVTSPPYAEQRKNTYGGVPEAEYPAWSVRWLNAARRALVDRGSALINIREHNDKRRGGLSDYVHRTRLAIREAGWIEVDELPWIKPNAPPTAPNDLPRRSWERILWFSPHRAPRVDGVRDPTRPTIRKSYKSLQLWSSRIGRSGTGSGDDYVAKPPRRPNWIIQTPTEKPHGHGYHPAKFPVALAAQMLQYFAPSGGKVVLDPFGGSGSTGLAAKRLGCRAVLIEQHEEFCEIAAKRFDEAGRTA